MSAGLDQFKRRDKGMKISLKYYTHNFRRLKTIENQCANISAPRYKI